MKAITNKKCSKHDKFEVQFVSSNLIDSQELQCAICLLKKQKVEGILSIQDILIQEDHLPIQNWPYEITQNQLEYLSNNSLVNKQQEIRNKMIKFYENLSNQICQALKQSQQVEISKIDQFKIGSNELIEFYNKQFQRDKLKEFFYDNNNFKSDDFKRFLQSIENQRQKDLNELEQMINRFEDVYNHIFFEQAKYIQSVVCDLIKNISFFSLAIQNKINNLNGNSRKDINIVEKEYIDLIKNINEKQFNFNHYVKQCQWDTQLPQNNQQKQKVEIQIQDHKQYSHAKELNTEISKDDKLNKEKILEKKTDQIEWKVIRFATQEKILKLNQFNDQNQFESDKDENQSQNNSFESENEISEN